MRVINYDTPDSILVEEESAREYQELLKRFRIGISKLAKDARKKKMYTVIRLRLRGKTLREIAEDEGVTEDTVERWNRDALAALRDLVRYTTAKDEP